MPFVQAVESTSAPSVCLCRAPCNMSPLLGSDIALVNVTTLFSEARYGPSYFWSRVAAAPRTSSSTQESLYSQVTKARNPCSNQCPASYAYWARCGSYLSPSYGPPCQDCCYSCTSEGMPHRLPC